MDRDYILPKLIVKENKKELLLVKEWKMKDKQQVNTTVQDIYEVEELD